MGGTGGTSNEEYLSPLDRLRLRSGKGDMGKSNVGAIEMESLCAAGNGAGGRVGPRVTILDISRAYHSKSESSSKSDSSEWSIMGSVEGR